MSATLGGAIKAYLESLGLGITVFTDAPPAKAQVRNLAPPAGDGLIKSPYVVVTGDITMGLDPLEDGATSTGTEEIQLDLYQNWRDGADVRLESPTLADAITAALHGHQLAASGSSGAPKRVYGILQRARPRTLDRNSRTVRHMFQFDVRRSVT